MSQTKTKYTVTRTLTITVDIEAKDDAEMRALYSDGTVDDHCSHNLWHEEHSNYRQYVYQVDGDLVDIWKEEVSDDND